jgi:hypothetical protein
MFDSATDENGSEWSSLALWAQLARAFSLLACCQAVGFPLRRKTEPKIIDSTKQFE